ISPTPRIARASDRILHSRRLDRPDEVLERVGRRSDIVCKLPDDPDRFGRAPDLHQLIDEILAGLEDAQEPDELTPRHAQIARCAFGLLDELAPFANQILLLLSGEACLLLEALELVARVTQRLGAELGHGTVVRDRAEQFADDSPQALDFLARLLDVGHAVDRFGAVLDL